MGRVSGRSAPAGFYAARFASAVCIGLALISGALLLASVGGLFSGSALAAVNLSWVILHLIGAGQFFLLVVGSMLRVDGA